MLIKLGLVIDCGWKKRLPAVASLTISSRVVYQSALQVKDDG